MTLHVITAVTRPENLPILAESLQDWCADEDVHWHIGFDTARRHVGGQAVKNRLLNEIHDGWVWFLDDDTVAHPGLYKAWQALEASQFDALVVSQRRADGRILAAMPANVRVNSIDIGQAILRRALIGDYRIPETYAGDGEFLETILDDDTIRVRYLPQVLCYHNELAP